MIISFNLRNKGKYLEVNSVEGKTLDTVVNAIVCSVKNPNIIVRFFFLASHNNTITHGGRRLNHPQNGLVKSKKPIAKNYLELVWCAYNSKLMSNQADILLSMVFYQLI